MHINLSEQYLAPSKAMDVLATVSVSGGISI